MAKETKARTSPVKYLEQVRQEFRKVIWPTRRETLITTILVMIVVAFLGLFFFIVDAVLANLIQLILALGAR